MPRRFISQAASEVIGWPSTISCDVFRASTPQLLWQGDDMQGVCTLVLDCLAWHRTHHPEPMGQIWFPGSMIKYNGGARMFDGRCVSPPALHLPDACHCPTQALPLAPGLPPSGLVMPSSRKASQASSSHHTDFHVWALAEPPAVCLQLLLVQRSWTEERQKIRRTGDVFPHHHPLLPPCTHTPHVHIQWAREEQKQYPQTRIPRGARWRPACGPSAGLCRLCRNAPPALWEARLAPEAAPLGVLLWPLRLPSPRGFLSWDHPWPWQNRALGSMPTRGLSVFLISSHVHRKLRPGWMILRVKY